MQQQPACPVMPQNTFHLILKNIHFCDNGDHDPVDKCSKVRPLKNVMQGGYKNFATANVQQVLMDFP